MWYLTIKPNNTFVKLDESVGRRLFYKRVVGFVRDIDYYRTKKVRVFLSVFIISSQLLIYFTRGRVLLLNSEVLCVFDSRY